MESSSHPNNIVSTPISGVCTALLVPRTSGHAVDIAAAQRLLHFQQQRGIRTFALNGATGEYTRSSLQEISQLLRVVRWTLGSDARLILGVGSADSTQAQRLIDLGLEVGVDGYLIPMPYYFPLQQQDLVEYVRALRLERPAYLYNLPAFTTPIAPETSLDLVGSVGYIVGVKDSSGNLDTVRLLSREAPGAARIIGSDGVLHAALAEKLCDGVVSGVAGVLPELIQALYAESNADAQSDRSRQLLTALTEYIAWLGKFPVPWGLKLTAEYRGLFQAEFSLPLSGKRRACAVQFANWLGEHREQLLIS